ncbi:hypothetical protein N7457_008714 [Penicillium paradoxum]|uniref:uncharacterized protein n=1 Tax=Penicillium paradoxum TaxID=176176 RepID=UPI00254713A6|nr:uncharacterized protein N7457_008714 [Penicillium paradoxum]KAJ5773818.1 hypothetical protein N7457_008714 [Penicillium paradoxum]
MSYYITVHSGYVQENHESKWVNIRFKFRENFLIRTEGALITYMIQRIRERKFVISDEPWDRTRRWCISIPISREHESIDTAAADAQQLVQWYRAQILEGNASINLDLLFDYKPYYVGKDCCTGNVCERMLYPELYKNQDEEASDTDDLDRTIS